MNKCVSNEVIAKFRSTKINIMKTINLNNIKVMVFQPSNKIKCNQHKFINDICIKIISNKITNLSFHIFLTTKKAVIRMIAGSLTIQRRI